MNKYFLYSVLTLSISTANSLHAQELASTEAIKEDSQIAEVVVEAPTEVSTEKKADSRSVFFVGVEDLAEKADKGDAKAQVSLANYFLYGTIVDKNEEIAAEYFAKAGDLGDVDAAYNAGVLYQKLDDTVEDSKKLAFKYFKIAANDNINAMYNLGACYVNGIGTRQDLVKAYYCFTKASEKFKETKGILRQLEAALGKDNLDRAKEMLANTDKI